MELQAVVSMTLAERHLDDVTYISICTLCSYGNRYMMQLVFEHAIQYMPCFANFSMTLQSEILSTKNSDFLKLIPCLIAISKGKIPKAVC